MPAASHPIPSPDRNHSPKRVASTTFRTIRVSVFTNGTIYVYRIHHGAAVGASAGKGVHFSQDDTAGQLFSSIGRVSTLLYYSSSIKHKLLSSPATLQYYWTLVLIEITSQHQQDTKSTISGGLRTGAPYVYYAGNILPEPHGLVQTPLLFLGTDNRTTSLRLYPAHTSNATFDTTALVAL